MSDWNPPVEQTQTVQTPPPPRPVQATGTPATNAIAIKSLDERLSALEQSAVSDIVAELQRVLLEDVDPLKERGESHQNWISVATRRLNEMETRLDGLTATDGEGLEALRRTVKGLELKIGKLRAKLERATQPTSED